MAKKSPFNLARRPAPLLNGEKIAIQPRATTGTALEWRKNRHSASRDDRHRS